MGLFDSERSDEGKRLGNAQLLDYDALLDAIRKGKSEFSDISNLGDVGRKFGITGDVSGIYSRQRRNLASNLARQRSAIGSRLGNSATPEFRFAPAESNYANQLADIGSNEASAELGQRNLTGNFLRDILEGKQSFGERKLNRTASALGGKGSAIEQLLASLSGSSPFDDFLSLVGTGAKAAGAIAGL